MDMQQQITLIQDNWIELLRKSPSSIGLGYHAITGVPYRGLNALVLALLRNDVMDHGYVTANDLEIHSAELVRHDRGTTLQALTRSGPVYYTVYPREDTKGLERFAEPTQFKPIASRYAGVVAWFERATDLAVGQTYGTLQAAEDPSRVLTSLAVWVVHRLRTAEQLALYHPQGAQAVSQLEGYDDLVAEIGALILANRHGFAYLPNLYRSFYLEFQRHPGLLQAAALDAQLAVDFLDNKVYDSMADEAERITE